MLTNIFLNTYYIYGDKTPTFAFNIDECDLNVV